MRAQPARRVCRRVCAARPLARSMSHLALRRVTIRLLHDPSFVDAVYATPDAALAGLDLTANERAWLLATPRAAWGADVDRPARLLAAFRDEFSAALRFAGDRPATFPASPAFHRAIDGRGSLAAAFAEHLEGATDARARALARLEGAIAAVRRAPRSPAASPAGRLRRTPRARAIEVPAGTLALFEALRHGAAPGDLGSGTERLLVLREATGAGVSIEELAEGLAGLLSAADEATLPAALHAEAQRLGATAEEAREIVDGLVADALLL